MPKADGEERPQPLPRGPHRLPREIVTDHQRRRLLTAAARALVEHGYAELTVEHIIREAGVSRTTFYEHFKNKRDCVLAAHGVAFERLSSTIVRGCESEREGPRKLVAGVSAAIDYAIAAPEEAQLLVLDVIGADPVIAQRALASSDLLVDLLRARREHSRYAEVLPELTERALVGAIVSVVADRLISGQADCLPELKPQLVQLALMPYVGIEEARRLATSGA